LSLPGVEPRQSSQYLVAIPTALSRLLIIIIIIISLKLLTLEKGISNNNQAGSSAWKTLECWQILQTSVTPEIVNYTTRCLKKQILLLSTPAEAAVG
jgi:hypothetical protein